MKLDLSSYKEPPPISVPSTVYSKDGKAGCASCLCGLGRCLVYGIVLFGMVGLSSSLIFFTTANLPPSPLLAVGEGACKKDLGSGNLVWEADVERVVTFGEEVCGAAPSKIEILAPGAPYMRKGSKVVPSSLLRCRDGKVSFSIPSHPGGWGEEKRCVAIMSE